MFYLLDERCRAALSCILPEEFDYYPIPSSYFYVASAKTWLFPKPMDPGYRFGIDVCRECGRPREIVWSKLPPTIAVNKQFLAINLEGIQGARNLVSFERDR